MGRVARAQLISVVLDASVAISWYIPDQGNPRTSALLRNESIAWHAPFCFIFEVSNVLLKCERRREVGAGAAESVITELRSKVRSEPLASREELEAAIGFGRWHRISVFDGLYLGIALKLGVELATRDGSLVAAAVHEGCLVHDLRAAR